LNVIADGHETLALRARARIAAIAPIPGYVLPAVASVMAISTKEFKVQTVPSRKSRLGN
jgi:hypothetical protein